MTEETTTDPRRGSAIAGLSVRTRITIAVAVLAALALAGAGFVVHALESAAIDRSVAAQIDQELAEFEQLREGDDPQTGRPFDDVRRLMKLFLKRNVPDDDEILVAYWDGEPQRRSVKLEDRQLSQEPRIEAAVQARLQEGGSSRIEGTQWGDVLLTVQPARDDQTAGAMVVVKFLAIEHQSLNQVMQTYAVVALFSLGLITAVAAWQAGRLLRPVRTLSDTAQQISETDLSRRIPESGNDDITALTRTFNEMLARLDNAFTGQREFIDAAGHELKTPLTVIRGHMELVDTADPTDVKTTRDLLLDEIDRMARLINDLIMLAKADRPDFVRTHPVEVAALTESVLDKCQALGDRDWQLDGTAQVVAELDQQRITQALLELAQNAVKHTRPGDVVALGSAADPGRGLRLWVRDSGHGVSDEHKDLIFERFGRAVVAEGDEGFGLGLSVVRAIAAGHGGTATVEDVDPHGARFVLTVPAQAPPASPEDAWPES